MIMADSLRRPKSAVAKGVAVILGFALALGVAGCNAGSPVSSGPPERTLSVGATLEPASMDPWHDT